MLCSVRVDSDLVLPATIAEMHRPGLLTAGLLWWWSARLRPRPWFPECARAPAALVVLAAAMRRAVGRCSAFARGPMPQPERLAQLLGQKWPSRHQQAMASAKQACAGVHTANVWQA